MSQMPVTCVTTTDVPAHSELEMIVETPQCAKGITKVLVDEFFCRFGPPWQLHSDKARQFEFKLIEEICTQLQIKKSHTSPYHSQGDG